MSKAGTQPETKVAPPPWEEIGPKETLPEKPAPLAEVATELADREVTRLLTSAIHPKDSQSDPQKIPQKRPFGVTEPGYSPWSAAESMDTFLSGADDDAEFLDDMKRFLVRECVTEIFSPRGLGKSLFALWLAVLLTWRGLRVLYIDRDNPRRIIKNRLRSFGAVHDTPNLKVISREKCPPLTNAPAWVSFPYADYDVVILDSLDSAAEGVGDQDSAKPSRAIAPLLDIARRERGPAVLILGNTVKSAAHSRGSGVIEDRADVVYEVRDATDFHPTGSKPWIEELPPSGADSWASRASRRKQREKYRLAFVASKFRIAEEPEPFILEINTTTAPWSVDDVTDEVDATGAAEREQRAKERADLIRNATDALVAEITRRGKAGEAIMLKDRDAVPFLKNCGLTRKLARKIIDNPEGRWILAKMEGERGHPVAVSVPSENDAGGGITLFAEGSKTLSENDTGFRWVHERRAAGTPQCQTPENGDSEDSRISAATTTFPPQAGIKKAVKRRVLEGDL